MEEFVCPVDPQELWAPDSSLPLKASGNLSYLSQASKDELVGLTEGAA